MLDSLRPDYLGCGGNKVVKTPNIDKVAEDGIFFENAYAEYPITIPSRTALVSGNYTFTNRPWCPLKEEDLHIAEILRDNGYITASFADSPFMGFGMDRGFDVFEIFPMGKCHKPLGDIKKKFPPCYYPPHVEDISEKKFYPNTMKNYFYSLKKFGKACPELLFDSAVEWIKKNKKRPFFIWIDSFEPHEPWCPPPPYNMLYQDKPPKRYIPFPIGPSSKWMTKDDIKHVLSLYMGDITHTDEQVGKVINTINELGLEKDTMVIIISDHGEPFGEHGTIRKYGVPLYDELSKMVFIIKKPGLIKPGRREKAFVMNIDLLPTITDLLKIDLGPIIKKLPIKPVKETYNRVDGESLVPILIGKKKEIRDTIYLGGFALRAGIRKGKWKFIDHHGEKPNELFNLEDDPKEKINLIKDKKDLAKELHYELWKFCSKWSAALSWRDKPVTTVRDGKIIKKIKIW